MSELRIGKKADIIRWTESRHPTDRFWAIRTDDDGLVHIAWVKNTIQGPWFLSLCRTGDEIKPKGATECTDESITCEACKAWIVKEQERVA